MPNFAAATKSNPHAVSWHDLFFRGIGSAALTQLLTADHKHDVGMQFDTRRMIALVACYLHRVASPLPSFLEHSLGQAQTRGLFKYVTTANCQVRVVDSLTGPTAEHGHVIRHKRLTLTADPHRGLQGDRQRFYVATSRGRSSLTVGLEQEPFGLPENRLHKLPTDHRGAEAQKLFSKL